MAIFSFTPEMRAFIADALSVGSDGGPIELATDDTLLAFLDELEAGAAAIEITVMPIEEGAGDYHATSLGMTREQYANTFG